MTSRLSLDYDKGIFVYHNPEDNTFKEVDGLLQVIVGIDPSHHSLNAPVSYTHLTLPTIYSV